MQPGAQPEGFRPGEDQEKVPEFVFHQVGQGFGQHAGGVVFQNAEEPVARPKVVPKAGTPADGSPPFVFQNRAGHVEAAPAQEADAPAEVEFFFVSEEIFVKKPGFPEGAAAVKGRCPRGAEDLHRAVVLAPVPFSAAHVPGIGIAVNANAHGVDGVRVVHTDLPGGANADSPTAARCVHQGLNPVRTHAGVVVQGGDKIAPGGGEPGVVALGIALIFRKYDEPHTPSVAFLDERGRPIAGRIVDHDNFQSGIGLVQQGIQAGAHQVASVPGEHHDRNQGRDAHRPVTSQALWRALSMGRDPKVLRQTPPSIWRRRRRGRVPISG